MPKLRAKVNFILNLVFEFGLYSRQSNSDVGKNRNMNKLKSWKISVEISVVRTFLDFYPPLI